MVGAIKKHSTVWFWYKKEWRRGRVDVVNRMGLWIKYRGKHYVPFWQPVYSTDEPKPQQPGFKNFSDWYAYRTKKSL